MFVVKTATEFSFKLWLKLIWAVWTQRDMLDQVAVLKLIIVLYYIMRISDLFVDGKQI